jgi:hypothetical protein
MPNTVRANARALPEATKSTPVAPDSPEATPKDEYLRLMADKIVADVRLEEATEKRKEEADAKDEDPKLQASKEFAEAYHAWLVAKADDENPSVEEEEAERFSAALPAAERRLMVTPAAWRDQLWQKLEAFESILGDEVMSGPRRDSILLLAVASIKQDIINMELLEAAL